MSYENGIISKTDPINVEEPYFVMGVAPLVDEDGDDLYDVGYAASNLHGRINMYAKYKPVRYDSPDNESNPLWWKASDGNCGFSIKQIQSYKELPDVMDGVTNGWGYLAPVVGIDWFRLCDFNGYNHRAIPFVSGFGGNELTLVSSTIDFSAMFSRGGNSDLLSIDDITDISECYFGVYIKKNEDNAYQRVTSQVKIKDGGYIATLSENTLSVGYWKAYPFLSKHPILQSGQDDTNTYYTLPNVTGKQIRVALSYFDIILIAAPLGPGDNLIKWKLTISNNAGGRTLPDNYLTFKYGDKRFSDPLVAGEVQKKLDDIYVGTMETITLTGTQQVPFDILNSTQGCKVWASFDSARILESTIVLPSRP